MFISAPFSANAMRAPCPKLIPPRDIPQFLWRPCVDEDLGSPQPELGFYGFPRVVLLASVLARTARRCVSLVFLHAMVAVACLGSDLDPRLAIPQCEGGKGVGFDPGFTLVPPRHAGKAGPVTKPEVVSRSDWGCPDGSRSPGWAPEFTVVTHLIVHHSAGANAAGNWAQVVRDIWVFHASSVASGGRGWGDIGYNYLIDPKGTIYEGRAGGDNVIGAHFSCVNGGTMGVCLLGTFNSVEPTRAALESLGKILAWKAAQRQLDPVGVTYHPGSKLPLPNISGHRHANDSTVACSKTECPGDKLFAMLPTIRENVKSLTQPPVDLPTVGTLEVQSITSSSAILRGQVVQTGGGVISDWRFDWGTAKPLNQAIFKEGILVNGNEFKATLNGLIPDTSYYYRAWARNQSPAGNPAGWGIGEILSFKTSPAGAPLIVVSGNGVEIANGGGVPNMGDSTDFGRIQLEDAAVVQRNFRIANNGNAELRLTGGNPVTIEGGGAFRVARQPELAVAPGKTTTFSIAFDVNQPGTQTATVSVQSNDHGRSPYTFKVSCQATRRNRPPVVRMDSPVDGAKFGAPADLTLSATASDPDDGDPDASSPGNGKLLRVDFYNGDLLVGSAAAAPYTFVWRAVPAGKYSIKAKTYDKPGLSAESGIVNVEVAGEPAWTVRSVAGVNGSVVPAGDEKVANGARKEYSATPANGYVVESWLVDGVVSQAGGNNFVLLNVRQSHEVRVTFKLAPLASVVRMGSVTGFSGGIVSVPVELVSQGIENALGFSINFDPAKLEFRGAELAPDAVGSQLIQNLALAAQGRGGVALGLAAGQKFPPGVLQILKLSFAIKEGLPESEIPLTYGDSPIAREVSDVSAVALGAEFKPGSVTVAPPGFEADVAPRQAPNNDGTVRTTDWVQVGRFVAGLDAVNAGGEFQRADCAPRASFGDGRLTATDWVQAGRYAAGLDPVVRAAGPSAPSVASSAHDRTKAGLAGPILRKVRLPELMVDSGEKVSVPILMESQGDENALGMSLSFDPTRFAYEGFDGGSAFGKGVPILNESQLGLGRIGVLQSLPFGQRMMAGAANLGTLRLRLLQASPGQRIPITFADAPVTRELSDALANSIDVAWEGGSVSTPALPVSDERLLEPRVTSTGVSMLLRGKAGERFAIEVSTDLAVWKPVATHVLPGEGTLRLSLAREDGRQAFYRAVPAADNTVVIQPGPGAGKDIWTTSIFSYAGEINVPGGGRDDHQLRVGGWGDLYFSLLEFDLDGIQAPDATAVLYLYCYAQSGGGTPMDLDAIVEPWDWRTQGSGRDRERLWWADRPDAEKWNTEALPVPVLGEWYAVDITELFRAWQGGANPNHGLQLRPLDISNNNFNDFYSSDYLLEPELRPKLVITSP